MPAILKRLPNVGTHTVANNFDDWIIGISSIWRLIQEVATKLDTADCDSIKFTRVVPELADAKLATKVIAAPPADADDHATGALLYRAAASNRLLLGSLTQYPKPAEAFTHRK